jgi:hypothetical protein
MIRKRSTPTYQGGAVLLFSVGSEKVKQRVPGSNPAGGKKKLMIFCFFNFS